MNEMNQFEVMRNTMMNIQFIVDGNAESFIKQMFNLHYQNVKIDINFQSVFCEVIIHTLNGPVIKKLNIDVLIGWVKSFTE